MVYVVIKGDSQALFTSKATLHSTLSQGKLYMRTILKHVTWHGF